MSPLLRLLFLISFVSLGCTPEIPDGTFACSDDVDCPVGFHCRFGELCYRQPLVDLPLYAHCDDDSNCASGDCYVGLDTDAKSGFCSQQCAGSTCPAPAGAGGGLCVGPMQCLASCMSDDDCPTTDMQCLPAPGAMGKTCMEVKNVMFASRSSCTSTVNTCREGLLCQYDTNYGTTGLCSWPCGMENVDSCPVGGECVQLPANLNVSAPTDSTCLAPCSGPPDCPSPLSCLAFPGTQKHCIPPMWLNSL